MTEDATQTGVVFCCPDPGRVMAGSWPGHGHNPAESCHDPGTGYGAGAGRGAATNIAALARLEPSGPRQPDAATLRTRHDLPGMAVTNGT